MHNFLVGFEKCSPIKKAKGRYVREIVKECYKNSLSLPLPPAPIVSIVYSTSQKINRARNWMTRIASPTLQMQMQPRDLSILLFPILRILYRLSPSIIYLCRLSLPFQSIPKPRVSIFIIIHHINSNVCDHERRLKVYRMKCARKIREVVNDERNERRR